MITAFGKSRFRSPLAPEEKITGVEFAALVRQQGFTGRVLLADIVDKIVDKQPAEWDVLNS